MLFYRKITQTGFTGEKFKIPLDFLRDMRYNIKVAMERYSNW